MKKVMKSSIYFLLLMMLVLAGCTSKPQNETASSTTESQTNQSKQEEKKEEPIEITMYYPIAVGGPLTEIIEKMADDFHKENPNITVKPVYTGSYQDTMVKAQTAVKGNNPPDLAVLLSTELFTLKDMDAIIPLDDYIKNDGGDEYINSFYPGFMENAQTEGSTYSIPFQRSTIVLYYNKEAFEEAGLDPNNPPTNWEELKEYSKKLTKTEGNKTTRYGVEIPSSGFPYWLFQAFAIQNGKNLMSSDGKEVYLDTKENVEALQLWLDLAKDKSMPEGVIDWATTPTNFIEGKTAMMYHTTGNLTNVKNNAKFDFGVAFLPAGGKGFGSPTGGGNFYLFKGTEKAKQDAAWKFIKWASQPEIAAKWSIDTGYVAVSPKAYETEAMKAYVEGFPQAAVARDQLEHAYAELSTHNNGQVSKVFNDQLQAVLTGQTTPEEALKKAQEEANKLLAPFKK
ncbi:ABC transporter substrate-binding protein [Bacillus sp. 31A1R]|uniref:ABC transporter substrate-binding protein n=1 Tax=Robertmurraya mangrovi TaxID=3098077 RepID=A0ABU5J1R7_9BACI|nr:ABC transporter substrate-binding protein [Bacillus sp. 31A1R]MDZ5473290.1 ABC transporter substrate-binding protein [Bacillus sp. 31A1R]